jgi:putative transposase
MAVRFEMIESIRQDQKRTGYNLTKMLRLYGVKKSTYYNWFDEQGELKPPGKKKPRRLDAITDEEIKQVLAFRDKHPNEGYRKFTWMMVDSDMAFMSESSVYNILSEHDRLSRWNQADAENTSKEYRCKPQYPHHHWHTDIAYIKVRGVFYFLIMLLDGYSRYLLSWELMTDMTGHSVEMFIQNSKEKYPHAKPMLIHDNGSQFTSHDFKKLVTKLEVQSVRTRRNHPQTNGKIERLNGSVKNEAIRPNSPNSYQEAWDIINEYSYTYNHHRLHAGINYLRPADMLFGRGKKVLNERLAKLANAKNLRMQSNQMSMSVH